MPTLLLKTAPPCLNNIFSSLRKILSIFALFFGCLYSSYVLAEVTSEFQTHYPVPVEPHSMIRLLTDPGSTCANRKNGVLMYQNGELIVCPNGAHSTYDPWAESFDFLKVYPRDTASNPNIKVGIGTKTPTTRLEIVEKTASGTLNKIYVAPRVVFDESAKIELHTGGIPTGAQRNMSFIDFLVADTGNPFDARIAYHNSAQKGLGIWVDPSGLADIWLDALTRNVGIGTETPTRKLEVNGGMVTDKIILKSDGVHSAELKVDYVPSKGKYYAVFAP